jgi:hypothetical protein
MASSLTAVWRTELGGEGNSGDVVANRRQGWVLWLRDNLTELTGVLIYSVH